MTIKNIKAGEFFRLKPNGKVYVRDAYNFSTHKYGYYDFEDVNNYHEAKATKEIITEFTF